MYIGVHVVTSLMPRNVLEYCSVTWCDTWCYFVIVLVMTSLYGLLKRWCSKPQGSTENDAKSNFFRNIYSEWVLTPYSQGAQEIPFKLHSCEPRLMGQWTNSNIRRTVTDGPFLRANMSKCTFNPKKKNSYWVTMCIPQACMYLQAWMFHASGIILYTLQIFCSFNLKILFNKQYTIRRCAR